MQPPTKLRSRNGSLALVILAVSAVVAFRLFTQATATANWEGFWFSLLHVAIIDIGSLYLLRDSGRSSDSAVGAPAEEKL